MMSTQIMAIMNVTPDSYFADSRVNTIEDAVKRALQMEKEGANILDIGGESTRPGSQEISIEEEIARVVPVIEALQGKLTIPISIDTKKPAVARAAVKAGATLLNDISGFSHHEMVDLAVECGHDICVMHMHGTPTSMQQAPPNYNGDVVSYLMKWFEEKVDLLCSAGVNKDKIILDPGIGFGKTVAHNLEIIQNLHRLKKLGFRVLLGASRKAFQRMILNKETAELLPSTIAVNTIAILQHVDILRVHDVREHRLVVDFMQTYKEHNKIT